MIEGNDTTAFPCLNKHLWDLKPNERKRIALLAHEAYGYRNEELVIRIPRTRLPAISLKVGDTVEVKEREDTIAQIMTITEITPAHLTLDGNHPLAGQDLVFDLHILDVREATPQEITEARSINIEGTPE